MFVGIDVAKAELVVSVLPSAERFSVANDERGVRTLVERLRALAPTLIVLEATRGHELLGVTALAAAALPVVVVNPRQVRDFAKATGQLPEVGGTTSDARGRLVPRSLHLLGGAANAPVALVHFEAPVRVQIAREALARLGLTSRQMQVAYLMAERYTHKEIAEQLGIKPNTARRHCERVLTGLGVHSRHELRQALSRVTAAPER